MAAGLKQKAEQYIRELQLMAHPEGGYYTSSYKCPETIPSNALPKRFTGDRVFSTAIFFLLMGDQYSSFHRIKSDEVWHFYDGSPLNIYVIHPNGEGQILKLGSDLTQGESFQRVVPAGCWFASSPAQTDGFSLVGCTVSPGFDFADFEMAKKNDLLSEYPQHSEWIKVLSAP